MADEFDDFFGSSENTSSQKQKEEGDLLSENKEKGIFFIFILCVCAKKISENVDLTKRRRRQKRAVRRRAAQRRSLSMRRK